MKRMVAILEELLEAADRSIHPSPKHAAAAAGPRRGRAAAARGESFPDASGDEAGYWSRTYVPRPDA